MIHLYIIHITSQLQEVDVRGLDHFIMIYSFFSLSMMKSLPDLSNIPDKESEFGLSCSITNSSKPPSIPPSMLNLKTSSSNKYTLIDLYKQAEFDASTIKLLFYGYSRGSYQIMMVINNFQQIL